MRFAPKVPPAAIDPVAERAASKVRRRVVPFLFVLYLFAYLDRINVGFAALQMNAALGFSSAVFGFGAGIFFLSYTAFEIPSNIILARVGARRWIARIMISWGIVSAAMMFTQNAAMFYTLRFLLGVAEAGFFPGIIYYLTQWVPAPERARTIAGFMTAVVTAGIIGGPVSGVLLSLDGAFGLAGWQWMFLLEGVPSVLLGFLVLRFLDDSPADARWLAPDERQALTSRLHTEASQPDTTHSVRDALRHPWLWVLAGVYFTLPVGLYTLGFFLPQILQTRFGGSAIQIGLLSAIPYLAGAVGMIFVSRHSDLTGERRFHVAGAAAVAGAALAATALVDSLIPAMVLLSIATIGLASIGGPFWSFATSFVSGAGAAAGIALINSIGNIGGFVGPYIVGYLRDRTEDFSASLIAVGMMIVAGAALALMVPAPHMRLADRRDEVRSSEPIN